MISKIYDAAEGVPRFEEMIFKEKKNKYCLCIPIINEGQRILLELSRGKKANISEYVDIVLCDGGSTDGSMEIENLKSLNVNTLLTKKDYGKQSVQLRSCFDDSSILSICPKLGQLSLRKASLSVVFCKSVFIKQVPEQVGSSIIICFFICVYFRTLSKEKRGNYYHITPRWLW